VNILVWAELEYDDSSTQMHLNFEGF